MVVPRNGDVYSAMGLNSFKSETGVPHEAMVEYLREYGGKSGMFGKGFFDTDIIRPNSTANPMTWEPGAAIGAAVDKYGPRGLPPLNVTMIEERGVPQFVVTLIPRSGGNQAVHVIEASKVGDFYKEFRKKQDTRLRPDRPMADAWSDF
jgi:hypothetical protein